MMFLYPAWWPGAFHAVQRQTLGYFYDKGFFEGQPILPTV